MRWGISVQREKGDGTVRNNKMSLLHRSWWEGRDIVNFGCAAVVLRLSTVIVWNASSVFESMSTPVVIVMVFEWVMISTRCSVLTPSVLQKVYTVRFVWSLR